MLFTMPSADCLDLHDKITYIGIPELLLLL